MQQGPEKIKHALDKPFSVACERNRVPILAVLRTLLYDASGTLLEIGSGTGQHAAYFAPEFPLLNWQPSDVADNLPGIACWCREAAVANLLPPRELDVANSDWRVDKMQFVYTANTLHIISWPLVCQFFHGISEVLLEQGVCIIYGPFNYHAQYTSDSNAQFDIWLKQRDSASAIRDFEAVCDQAQINGLALLQDNAMPANNRLLVFRKV